MTQMIQISISHRLKIFANKQHGAEVGDTGRYFISIRDMIYGQILIALILTKKIKKRSSKFRQFKATHKSCENHFFNCFSNFRWM